MTPTPDLSVILPTHNPDPDRLARTLAGLRAQTLPAPYWELVVVDNASSPPVDVAFVSAHGPADFNLVREPRPGLTAARLAGFAAARAPLLALVDDDNFLAPDYLARAIEHMTLHPELGACGGPSRPEFAGPPPPPWAKEFFPLLALRDLGDAPIIEAPPTAPASKPLRYPACSPIGAGMVLRRAALATWLNRDNLHAVLTDRRGDELTSGGDNDIVFTLLRDGWSVGYFPDLALTHLIPEARLQPAYLARLNRGIQRSWMQVLRLHDANPWAPVPRWSVPLRQAKSWLTRRAWSGPAARIRWQGDCGHFEGRAP